MTQRTPARQEQALTSSDDAFRLLLLNHPVPMFVYATGTLAFLEVNDAAVRRYGYSRDEFLAMTITDLRPPEDVPRLLEHVARVAPVFQESGEWRHRLKDGRVIDVAITSHALVFRGREARLVSAQDETRRKRAEEHLRRVNRVYAVTSDVNEAIARIREPHVLFERACHIAVESGGFRMAWIGVADDVTKEVQVIAHAGVTDGYLEKLHIVLNDSPRGRGPVAMALRAGHHVIANDIAQDSRLTPWREDALRLGYHAVATFPLKVNGETKGVFNLYASETDFFDDDEVALLDELVRNLSFAMEFADKEEQRRQAEQALQEKTAQLEMAVRGAGIGIWRLDFRSDIVTMLQGGGPISGLPDGLRPTTGEAFYALIHPDDRGRVARLVRQKTEKREEEYRTEYQILLPGGTVRWVVARGRFIYDAEGTPLLLAGVDADITERKRAEEATQTSHSLLAATMEATADGILVVDLAGAVVRFNRRFLELWRIPETLAQTRDDGQLLGFVVAQLLEPEAFLAGVRALYQTPDASGTDELRFKDGRIFERFTGPQRIGEAIVGRIWSFRDITERRRAEEAVRQSEALSRNLVGHLPQRIFIKDRNSAYLFCNGTYALDLGIGPKQIVGKDDFAFFSKELAERYRADDREVMASGKIKDTSERYEVAGEERWVHTLKIPYRDEHGEIIGVLGLFEDITTRRRAEEALRESEERFRKVFEDGPLGMVLTSVGDGRFLAANAVFCQMLGYSEEELKRLSFENVTHPEHRAQDVEAVQRLWQGHVPHYRTEKRYLTKMGETIWAELSASVVRSEDGKPLYALATVENITERRSADESLRLQSAALNAAANAMVITDRDGTIVWSNPAFTTLTGYSADEARGSSMRDLVKSGVHDHAFYKNMWDTILAGHVWWCGDMTNRRKDGSLYHERQTITPVKDAHGEITHFIALKRDLTEQRQLEAQLNQAQRMESVGRLAGGIAHDFNNLLTVINSYAELAAVELKEGDPLREMLREIGGAGQRAAALTRQLLAFSRRQMVQPIVLDLNAVVADMEKMLQRLIGEDVALVFLPADHLGCVKADPGQIEQVIMNLAVNARDAMPAGGALTIVTANVEFDEVYVAQHAAVQAGPHVMLAISDTGVGMDEATRERIFEPFFTTKDLGHGTGLGLSTVYGIVKQSEGSVWVYTEVGKGTTFKIYLPRVEEAAHERRPTRTLTPLRGTETILLVEDEPTVLILARRILESAGYKVLPAANGGEALLLLERLHEPVHLVMTDVVMPGMSGPHLAERLGVVHPGMKILYTSGYTDDEVVRRGILTNVAQFISKPYTISELTRKVREVLDRPE